MSILAHLVGDKGEPGATRALAYLLNRHADLLGAFVNNLPGAAGIQFNPRPRVESEIGGDGGRPDMRIHDVEGNLRILVENKFWAGLTAAQPMGYLGNLPNDVDSGLLFIVPRQRVNMIWNALQARCQDAGLDLGQGLLRGDRVKWVPAGAPRTMLVTDWQMVLGTLERAVDGEEVQCDVRQFRQLVERLEDAEAFPALRSDEVTNADVARRMINYIDLLQLICDRLVAPEAGIACGNNTYIDTGTYKSIWRSLRRHGHEVGWLTISFRAWCRSGGITPLWLWMSPGYNPNDRTFNELENLCQGVYEADNNKFIPIRLELGVEQERVVERAVEQIRDVFEKLT